VGRRLFVWLGLIPLAGLTVLVLLPVLWMLSTSFQASEKMFQLAMEWIPATWHPENYPNALLRAPFPLFFMNSLIVSTVVMIGNVVFCTLAGYGLAKFRFPGDRFALLAILSTLMLPLEVTLVPTFLIVHSLGWLNTYQGIFAPLLVDAFGIFLMRQFVLGVPSDYLEAARIDGAGELRLTWSIVLPLLSPTLLFCIVVSVIQSFRAFDQIYVMTGGGPGTATMTLVFYLYQQGFGFFNTGQGAAVSVLLLLALMGVTAFQLRLARRWVSYEL